MERLERPAQSNRSVDVGHRATLRQALGREPGDFKEIALRLRALTRGESTPLPESWYARAATEP